MNRFELSNQPECNCHTADVYVRHCGFCCTLWVLFSLGLCSSSDQGPIVKCYHGPVHRQWQIMSSVSSDSDSAKLQKKKEQEARFLHIQLKIPQYPWSALTKKKHPRNLTCYITQSINYYYPNISIGPVGHGRACNLVLTSGGPWYEQTIDRNQAKFPIW